MINLTKYFKLPRKNQILLIKTLLTLVKVRLMLWFMSFHHIQKYFSNIRVTEKRDKTVCELSWSLKVVSHYLPGTTCLTNALAGYILLSKHGYSSLVKIGVGKSDEGEFEAHAWLEYGDRIIIGESEKEYVPLFDLNIQ